MSLRSSLGLVVLLGSARAAAERPIVVELAGPLAFDAGELTAALRVRVAPNGAQIQVRVTASTEGVIVAARGTTRSVAIGDRHGAEAARLVALAASDLLLDDLAAPPAVEPRPLPWTIAALGSVAAWDAGAFTGGTIEVTVPRAAWLVTASVGGGALVGAGVHASEGVVRIGAGRRVGWLDLTAGLTLAPVVVSDGVGDRTVLVGGGLAARLRLPIAGRARIVVAAGADAFATRSEYSSSGRSIAATPWFAPWLAIGLEVAP